MLLDLCRGLGARLGTLIAAGLAAALPAAATGLADWSALHRHQQRVGLVHAITQAGATPLFAGSLLARAAGRPGTAGAGRRRAGTATAGAYLGGHLALRLGAGASHAESGRPPGRARLAGPVPAGELPEGRPARRQLGYLSLLAVRAASPFTCSPTAAPTSAGRSTRAGWSACGSSPA